MVILIFIVVILMLLFKYFSPPKPSGVVLYFANIGTGKTTLLSKIAIKEQRLMKKGKSKYKYIVSNALISGVTYIPNIRDLLKRGAMQHTLILIDEGSIVYNNRKMNLSDMEVQYFKFIRHYTSTLIVLSQSHDDIDVTLRRLYTQIYILRKMPLFTLIQPIKKKISIDEISKQIIDEYRFCIIFSWRMLCRPLYFKFFNSWWVPSDVPIHDLSSYEKQPIYQKKKRKFHGFIKESQIEEIIKN